MATYPIKMLKDEQNIPFVPLVSTEGIQDPEGLTLEQRLLTKLGPTNLHGGANISVRTEEYDCYIDLDLPATLNIIDNLITSTSGQGALDAHQGYILKNMIDNLPRVIDDITSTSQIDALSANQGRILNINKQDKLISGTNLKTINNESLLGSGNITITEVVDNLNGNEISLAPSVRAIKSYICNYSNTEHRIGTWTNGKPLYQITVEKLISNTDAYDIRYTLSSLGLSNIDNIYIDEGGSFARYEEQGRSPITYYTSVNDWAIVYIDGSKQLTLRGNNGMARTFYISLNYTKTTD